MTWRPSARIVTLVALGLLATAEIALAQEAPAFAKNGLFVSASALPDFHFDGVTFDGESVYQRIGGEEIILLPKLQPKSTFRGTVGYRLTRGSFEVGYENTHHDATFMGLNGEATFHTLNFDERIYLLTRGRIQPYGLLGFSVPWLTITDGSALGDRVGDGTFRGMGVNTEAGVTLFPHPRIGVSVGYRFRAMWFDRATGVTDTLYELHPRFRETAGSLAFGASFTF